MSTQPALPLNEDVQSVADRLCAVLVCHARGRRNAMTRAELCRWCSCRDRTLRRAKALLVANGHPVGARTGEPGGYYWINDPEELRAAKAQHRARLIAHARALAGLERGGIGQRVLAVLGEV